MNQNRVDTRFLASLSRLKLNDSQHEKMAREIEEFAEFAAILGEFDPSPALRAERELYRCNCREDVPARGDKSLTDGLVCVPLTVEADV